MERLSQSNVNPDLVRERSTATFNPQLLTELLDGGAEKTRRRRYLESTLLKDRAIVGEKDFHFMTREEKYSDAVRKSVLYLNKIKELSDGSITDNTYIRNILFPNETSPIGLNLSMFKVMLETQGTQEQIDKWLNKSQKLDIIGTYAQTELGHGSHVRNLETTATYDKTTEQFILHTPTLTATKFWPGGLGRTTNYCVLMAQLIIDGVSHGVHPFVIQTRDLSTHEPLPGVTLGDIGPKFGYDTMDNGFMRLNHYRVPRDSLLMRLQEVTKDGRYIKKSKHDKLVYGAMLATRAAIIVDPASRALAQAATIAVRYSCVRHQSELVPGEAEPAVLEYRTQQYRVFTMLAAAYAYTLTALHTFNEYLNTNQLIQEGQVHLLPELHALSAGLKAVVSAAAMSGVEQCRLACGGHGYSQSSGLPKIYTHTIPACTYEGENTVMLLQTARYLVKCYQQAAQGKPVTGSCSYLTQPLNNRSTLTSSLQPTVLVQAFRDRAHRLIANVSRRLSKLTSEGRSAHEAGNSSAVLLVKAAEAHCQFYIIDKFWSIICQTGDKAVASVLTTLLQLHACYTISSDSTGFLIDGYLTQAQMDMIADGLEACLTSIRPNAVALADSFDFTDHHLGSVIGRYDGRVYENLFEWAAKSPLNKTQVHDSFRYIKALQQQSKL